MAFSGTAAIRLHKKRHKNINEREERMQLPQKRKLKESG